MIIFPNMPATFHSWFTKTTPITGCGSGQRSGICVRTINGQPIGISDGQYRFWTNKFADSVNAEEAIYQENKNITTGNSGAHFVTIVVASTFSQGPEMRNSGVGYDNVQAAYLLQHEANDGIALQDRCPIRDSHDCLNIYVLLDFYCDYRKTFDPNNLHPGAYG